MASKNYKVTMDRTIRFRTLDRCFSDQQHYYYIEDLVNSCNKSLRENGMKEVCKRTIWYDIQLMEGDSHWSVDLIEEPDNTHNGRRFFRYKDPNYSIWKTDLSEEQLSQLKNILIMLRQFDGIPQYERMEEMIDALKEKYAFSLEYQDNIISFDTNQYLKGVTYLSALFNNIVRKQVLKIEYQPFGKDVSTKIIHPYFLKQYNGRWFLFGLDNSYYNINNLALDRIKHIECENIPFIESGIDFSEYFEDYIGVTKSNDPIEKILLKFSKNRFYYVKSKPLHWSQKERNKDEGLIEISVKPNKELYQMLLSFGEDVEVISPDDVRSEMKRLAETMYNKYK